MIHYFIYNNSNDKWHDIKMEAWKEDLNVTYSDTNKEGSSFSLIEKVRFFCSTDFHHYESCTFNIDFGQDSSYGHSARTVKDLVKDKTEDKIYPLNLSTKADYLNLRNKLFGIYKKAYCIDFETVKEEGDYTIHRIW